MYLSKVVSESWSFSSKSPGSCTCPIVSIGTMFIIAILNLGLLPDGSKRCLINRPQQRSGRTQGWHTTAIRQTPYPVRVRRCNLAVKTPPLRRHLPSRPIDSPALSPDKKSHMNQAYCRHTLTKTSVIRAFWAAVLSLLGLELRGFPIANCKHELPSRLLT